MPRNTLASVESSEPLSADQRHATAGDRRTCLECGARITLQPSRCPCGVCRNTLYIPAHSDSKGIPCVASSHGWKEPVHVEPAQSEQDGNRGEANA